MYEKYLLNGIMVDGVGLGWACPACGVASLSALGRCSVSGHKSVADAYYGESTRVWRCGMPGKGRSYSSCLESRRR